jgi:hypothetical protein
VISERGGHRKQSVKSIPRARVELEHQIIRFGLTLPETDATIFPKTAHDYIHLIDVSVI